eukprot:RCo000495
MGQKTRLPHPRDPANKFRCILVSVGSSGGFGLMADSLIPHSPNLCCLFSVLQPVPLFTCSLLSQVLFGNAFAADTFAFGPSNVTPFPYFAPCIDLVFDLLVQGNHHRYTQPLLLCFRIRFTFKK